jgi:hypothetical protein
MRRIGLQQTTSESVGGRIPEVARRFCLGCRHALPREDAIQSCRGFPVSKRTLDPASPTLNFGSDETIGAVRTYSAFAESSSPANGPVREGLLCLGCRL